jgi:lipoprotein Spr
MRIHFLLLAFALSFSCFLVSAQDTTRISFFTSPSIIIDTAKVDSFYKQHNIDIYNTTQPELYFEIFRWLKTGYCYGGNSQRGIDCSHFVNMLYQKIYNKKLNNSSTAMVTQCKLLKGGVKNAAEGDLLFFKIKKKRVSHVGIYLQNKMFAHAATQTGITISSIEEPYYKKHFYKAGRIK